MYYLTDTELRVGATLTDVELTDSTRVEVDLSGLVLADEDGHYLDGDFEATGEDVLIGETDIHVSDELDSQQWPYTALVLLTERAVSACRVVE